MKKYFRPVALLIKITIVFVAFYYIYQQMFVERDIHELSAALNRVGDEGNIVYLVIVAGMMLLNWSIEAKKWQFLVSKVERIPFLLSLKAIFSGVTVSVFTPNKIGEYGGRVFHLKEADKVDAIVITWIGSMSQLMITMATGIIALAYFYPTSGFESDELKQSIWYGLVFMSCAIIGVTSFAFFFTGRMKSLADRFPRINRFRKYGRALTYFNTKELLTVIGYSFVRFLVFSTQMYLLLWVFGVHIPVQTALFIIPIIFFMITVIPRPIAFAELGVRSSTALYFLLMYSDNSAGILLAMFSLWIINLAIPALIGGAFIFNMRFSWK